MTTDLIAYRARWIVPVDARPIEHGVVVVADGRIVSVQTHGPKPCVELGDVALIPGLVNCHTHLEFSELTAPIPAARPFPRWLRGVIARRQGADHHVGSAIRQGLAESVAAGTTLLGEIATYGWTWEDYASATVVPRGVLFQEVLGLSDARITAQRELIAADAARSMPPGWGYGLSPHAPYSTHPELFAQAVRIATERDWPIAIHLAETMEERELLHAGTGPFRDFLTELGIWRPEVFGGRTCGDWIDPLTGLSRGLVIHGNYLTTDELADLARSPQLTLVYCPRTHAAFNHPPHPWRDLLEMGGSVALGTDGRSSNPDLSLWRELQFLADLHDDVPHHQLLKLGTLAGARALGQSAQCGSLTPGKRADLVLIRLADADQTDPNFTLLDRGNHVVNTMVGGRWRVPLTS
jgi:cytosine/adenosine deaminase-related metal-dependent hydrolase